MLGKTITVNQLFAAAMVQGISLAAAAKDIDAPLSVLTDAVCYRMNHAVDRQITDYQQSLFECFKRLEEAN